MELPSQVKLLSLKELAARKVLKQQVLTAKIFELNILPELKTYLLSIDDKILSAHTHNVIKRVWDEKGGFTLFVNGILRDPNRSIVHKKYYQTIFFKEFLADSIDAYDNSNNS